MINRQNNKQILDLATKIYDEEFVRECMISRTAQVKYHLENDQISQFQVTTSKIYKPDYVSCTLRTQDDFDQIIDHINQLYGGLIIPVVSQIDSEEQPEEAAIAYEIYLNQLLEHRDIRTDSILFAFFFVQQHQSPYRSKYERFLSNAIQLSRKHISQLFTREDGDQLIMFDKELQQCRQIIAVKKMNYQKIGNLIRCKVQQHQNLSQILKTMSMPYSGQVYHRSRQLSNKSQRIFSIFNQIQGAYQRRVVMKQHIKELKADAIRHKYNPKHESTEKLLQKQRHRHQTWNQTLLKDIQCNTVILDSLIKEVVMNYQIIEQLIYEQKSIL